MLDTYWNNTNNCLKNMKTTMSISNMAVCNKHGCKWKGGRSKRVYKGPVVFRDYRPMTFTRAELAVINRLGLPIRFSSWSNYDRVLYRIFANPAKELRDKIVSITEKVPFNQVTTIHVRSGGVLANTREGAYWVTPQELPRLVNTVNHWIRRRKLGQLIYLTTDSDKVNSYFHQHLQNVEFLELNVYNRSHTTGSSKDEAFRAALFDLTVSAQGSSVLFTPRSGYSTAIRSLSQSRRQYQLPLNRRYMHKR